MFGIFIVLALLQFENLPRSDSGSRSTADEDPSHQDVRHLGQRGQVKDRWGQAVDSISNLSEQLKTFAQHHLPFNNKTPKVYKHRRDDPRRRPYDADNMRSTLSEEERQAREPQEIERTMSLDPTTR